MHVEPRLAVLERALQLLGMDEVLAVLLLLLLLNINLWYK